MKRHYILVFAILGFGALVLPLTTAAFESKKDRGFISIGRGVYFIKLILKPPI